MRAFESFIGSLGILVAGFLTIPIVGKLAGVEMTATQGVEMSAFFFIGRFVWLYALRVFFSNKKEKS